MARKIESWIKWGRVIVTRDARGRFVSWKRAPANPPIRIGPSETAIARYGTVRRGGKTQTMRIEFVGGSGKDKYRAAQISNYHPPDVRHRIVRTEDYLRNPLKYSGGGDWIDSKVESK